MLSPKQLLMPAVVLGVFAVTSLGAWELFGPGGFTRSSIHRSKENHAISFNERIQPILSENCYHCHGTDAAARKGGLRLDKEVEAKAVRPGHQAAIVAGHPEESEMIRRILSEKPGEAMPPRDNRKPLKPEDIDTLRQWIAEGAHYEPHWSLVKPVRPPIPLVTDTNWGVNPIDQFVLARLEKEGLAPEPEADPRTLIRRVTLDLTGLPPKPEEVEAFVKNPTRAEYEKVVDRLLASPSFGEAQGRIWLDAARYGDTHGIHIDNYRSIWPYRDWVINAFNSNQPFNSFLTEQLAGDLLPGSTDKQKIATGFLRCQVTTGEGGSIEEEVRCTMAAEEVQAVATVFTGLTMQCCTCHDHKFDPLTQKDFYRFSAFFRNTTQAALDGNRFDNPPALVIPLASDKARWEALPADIAASDKALNEAKGKPSEKSLKDKRDALEKERNDIISRSQVSLIEEERKDSTPKAHILKRGQYDQPGEEVTAGVPMIFPQIPKDQPQNRLGLAKWLVNPENPLTARVTVNRFWQEFFGNGIVKTSEDFGLMGERPVNQPLLDWLAVEFRDGGWDMKKMMRLMVTSAAYKQSAVISAEKLEKDPENRLCSRGPRFRMDGEVIRDQALAASGLLNPKIGGPSVKPYQPQGLWEEVAMPESNTKHYDQDTGDKLYRRSMYTFLKRSSPNPDLETMGMPTREVCTVRRLRTNTPLQALVVMNDPQYVEAARKLALDAIKATNDPALRLDYFSERLIARPLTAKEKETLLQTGKKIGARYAANPAEAQALLTNGQLPPDKTIPAQEQATWTVLASILLNLDETLNR